MSKSRYAKHDEKELLLPLDLVLARFGMNQIELAAALDKDRSLPSHWRNRYGGYIPAASWDEIVTYAENHGKRITLDELRSGGYA